MSTYFVWALVFISASTLLLLWFMDVKRIMTNVSNTVVIATEQLSVNRIIANDNAEDPAAAAVFVRSYRIYQQAVDIYNRTLNKPWVFLPALCMGFRTLTK